MRTKLFSLLLLVGISLISSAQDNLDKIIHVWGKDFWGMSPITVDHSGNIYLSGVFADTVFFGSKDNWLVNMDSSDFFITKIYPDGTMAWTKVITGIGSETFEDIEVDIDGNVYIIGQFDQTMIIDTYSYDTYGLFESIWTGDHFLCKLDPDGNLVDLKRGSENGENLIFRAIELDGNGEICLIGQTEGSQVFDFQIEPIEGHWHSFMVKLNSSFDPEWIISICDIADIPNPGVCVNDAIVSDQLNNIYISGRVETNQDHSIYISKVDKDGSLLWIDTIAVLQETGIRDVFVDKHNDVYFMTNISTNNLISFPDPITGSAFVAKYNDEGEYLWSIGLPSPLSTYVVTGDGYTIASLSKDWPILDSLIIIDPFGEIVYDQPFENIEIQSLTIDEGGNVYFNGYFQEEITIGNQVVSPLKSENYLFGRLDVTKMLSSSNTEYIKQYDTYHVYPNPFTDYTTIKYADAVKTLKIELLDIHGRIVRTFDNVNSNSVRIHRGDLPSGIYFIRIQSENTYIKKVIIR